MNEIIEITAKDNHQFSAYISQPSGKPKAGILIIQEMMLKVITNKVQFHHQLKKLNAMKKVDVILIL